MATKTDCPQIADDLLSALTALVDAIDFEGADGRIAFTPGTPFEWTVLREARAVIARAKAA